MTISVTIKHAGGAKTLEVVEKSSNGVVNRMQLGEEITLTVYDARSLVLREAEYEEPSAE